MDHSKPISTVFELIPRDFRCNCSRRCPDYQLCEFHRILVASSLKSILHRLFYDGKGVFDGIEVWRVRGKVFELATVIGDCGFDILPSD
jgi:hypothetical protein